jgi:hypothetical protein
MKGVTRRLWFLGVLAFGVGDVATTLVGLETGVAVESNPLPRQAIALAGTGSLVAIKSTLLATVFAVARALEGRLPGSTLGAGVGFSAVGVPVTTWNVAILLVGAGVIS